MNETTGVSFSIQTKKSLNSFEKIYSYITEGNPIFPPYNSYKEFFEKVLESLKYYENNEKFEKCAILKEYISDKYRAIPSNIDEAIEKLRVYTRKLNLEHLKTLEDVTPNSMAIKLHQSLGNVLIDSWLLGVENTPFTMYYTKKYNITNKDDIMHDLLLKFFKIIL